MTRERLPVIDPPADTATEESGAVHGVVLAAGTSSRYGSTNKLLESVDGEPLLCRVVATVLESQLADVTVVLGYESERVREALPRDDLDVRYNESYEDGQSTSVAEGVNAARERNADAVLFALGDMPLVSTRTVDTLIRAYRRGCGSALAAGCDGNRGNPVLFDSHHYDALCAVTGDTGGRDVLYNATDAAVVETGDPGVLYDVDRPTDRERLENGSGDSP